MDQLTVSPVLLVVATLRKTEMTVFVFATVVPTVTPLRKAREGKVAWYCVIYQDKNVGFCHLKGHFNDLREYNCICGKKKSTMKPFVAPVEAACNLINCLRCLGCIVGNVGTRFCKVVHCSSIALIMDCLKTNCQNWHSRAEISTFFFHILLFKTWCRLVSKMSNFVVT